MTKREQTLTDRVAERGWNLEHADAGWRITTDTGTLVAAVWTEPDGYGLTLDQIEAILDGTYVPPAPSVPVEDAPDAVLITTTD